MPQYSSAPQLGQYSGLQRMQSAASQPSQFDMIQRGSTSGPGSAAFKTRQAAQPWSLPPSQQKARKVGRSSYDVTRLAEQAFRRTRDPYQRLQIGMIRDRYAPDQTDELDTLAAQAEDAGPAPIPATGVPMTSPATAGRDIVNNSFTGVKNPATASFQRPRNPLFGRGLGVLNTPVQPTQPFTIYK